MDSGSQDYDSQKASEMIKDAFCKIVARLATLEFLVHHLSASYGLGMSDMKFKREKKLSDEVEHAKYMGLCRHPDYTRHRLVA